MRWPLVVVTWDDAARDSEWHYSDEEFQEFTPSVCVSVGWLVHRDERRIVLARDTDPEHSSSGALLVIPRGWETKVEEICSALNN